MKYMYVVHHKRVTVKKQCQWGSGRPFGMCHALI